MWGFPSPMTSFFSAKPRKVIRALSVPKAFQSLKHKQRHPLGILMIRAGIP